MIINKYSTTLKKDSYFHIKCIKHKLIYFFKMKKNHFLYLYKLKYKKTKYPLFLVKKSQIFLNF